MRVAGCLLAQANKDCSEVTTLIISRAGVQSGRDVRACRLSLRLPGTPRDRCSSCSWQRRCIQARRSSSLPSAAACMLRPRPRTACRVLGRFGSFKGRWRFGRAAGGSASKPTLSALRSLRPTRRDGAERLGQQRLRRACDGRVGRRHWLDEPHGSLWARPDGHGEGNTRYPCEHQRRR